MTQDQQGRTKIVLRCAEEEQINAARTKQHEDEEEDSGKWPAGREKNGNRETRKKRIKNKQVRQQVSTLPRSRYPHRTQRKHAKPTTHSLYGSRV